MYRPNGFGILAIACVAGLGGCGGGLGTINFGSILNGMAPTISVGLSPATLNVALGKQQQLFGYSVGSVNQGLTRQVNGVAGGPIAYGTISQSTYWPFGGLYTVPATMPMSGPAVTIAMISQADPTKTATATVTLQ